MKQQADVVIVGAGAAGLTAGTWAGRTHPHRSVVILDGARKLGAKILISGGGRCNVTHYRVNADAFAGSSPHAIKKVLRRFDVPDTVNFFRELGVELKQEETGKLFPVTNSARTILDALLRAAQQNNVRLHYPYRVTTIARLSDGFRVMGEWGYIDAGRVILATGGKSLPKTGSDGYGYALAQSLGHHITGRVFPALVPLTLPRDHFICRLSGLTLPATLTVWSAPGKQLASFTNSTLCTHFGLSGPSVLDISRYYINAGLADPDTSLTVNWLPTETTEQLDRRLQALRSTTVLTYLRRELPERLVEALCREAGVAPETPGHQLSRAGRKALSHAVTRLSLPVTGNRGYNYAEVTAGGIPLAELHLNTMESRFCPGLYFCGEICDVDGRIGGFNFQWAWASSYTAGVSV